MVLPIVERELRVAARKPWTQGLRFAVAAVALLAWGVVVVAGEDRVGGQSFGRYVLHAAGVPAFAFCLLAGVFLTSDCIASERRERTLGLLLLTRLRGYDLALGKLAASSLTALQGLLAVLPLLALPVLFGGVRVTDCLRLVTALGVVIGLSLTTGLVVSTFTTDARRALMATLTLLAVATGGPWVLEVLARELVRAPRWVANPTLLLSPAFIYAFAPSSAGPTILGAPAWTSALVLQAGLALGALGLACFRMRRQAVEQDEVQIRSDGATVSDGPGIEGSPSISRPVPRRHDAKADPWLLRTVWYLLLVEWLLLFAAGFNMGRVTYGVAVALAYAIHTLAKCHFAVDVTRQLGEEHASGALEVLLTTPLSAEAILRRYHEAADRRQGGISASVLLASLEILAGPLAVKTGIMSGPRDDAFWMLITAVTGCVLYILDKQGLRWVGTRLTLRTRKPMRAALGAVARVLVPGWFAAFLYLLGAFAGLIRSEWTFNALLCVWMVSFVLYDRSLIQRVQPRVVAQFRELAAGVNPSTGLGKRRLSS